MASTTKAPEAPKAPTAPTAPAATPAPAAAKPAKKPYTLHKDAQTATDAVKGLVKGQNRAFKCTLNGKVHFITAVNACRAGESAYLESGGVVEELGVEGRVRAPKVVGVEGVMAAVNALPEDQRKAVMEQLKALAGAK